MVKLLFDPNQLRSFGGEYVSGEGYSIRMIKRQKIIWNSIYIPYGPNIDDIGAWSLFIEYIKKIKLSRIKIDLPLILDSYIIDRVHVDLNKCGFKSCPYSQDEETILINKLDVVLDNKDIRYYIRKSEKKYCVEVITSPDNHIIEELYNVYAQSANRIGYVPKSIKTMYEMSKSSIIAVAKDKSTNTIDSFVWGMKYEIFGDYSKKEAKTMLEIIYIGSNDAARMFYTGYAMHKELFDYALYHDNIDIINFRGASRTMDRKYLEFKKNFGGKFVKFAGAFERVSLL